MPWFSWLPSISAGRAGAGRPTRSRLGLTSEGTPGLRAKVPQRPGNCEVARSEHVEPSRPACS
eukprot:11729393-Alexandrium_andersonii.AAC.1